MTHRRVTARRRNGAEALLNKAWLLLTERQLLFLCFTFGERIVRGFTGGDLMRQPRQKIHPCRAIVAVAMAVAFQLGLIFLRFDKGDGIGLPDHVAAGLLNGETQCNRGIIRIQRNSFLCGNLLNAGNKGFLRCQRERGKKRFGQSGRFARGDKPFHLAGLA